ncbi:MAG: histidine kinase dimerization/phospho-acceptor domain-containing protein [bacterium]
MKQALKIISPQSDDIKKISAIRKSEHESKNAFSEQRTAYTAKTESCLGTLNELVLTISHYLNSPLTILLGKVEILSETVENGKISKEDLKRSLHTCKREILRIDTIVKSFQNLCRVQHKRFPPGIKMLDVEQEIKNRIEEISFLR